MLHSIGLVGGLGVGATVHYYQELARKLAESGGATNITISHADLKHCLDLLNRNALDELGSYFSKHIDSLARAGARFAAISAVTAHICIPQLKQKNSFPLVDIVECIADELSRRGAKRIGILGSRFVMESDVFGRLRNFEAVKLEPSALEFVHENYMKIAAAGSAAAADVDGIARIARVLVDKGADIVVLAGTELSLAFSEESCGFPALDSSRAHIDALVRRFRAEG